MLSKRRIKARLEKGVVTLSTSVVPRLHTLSSAAQNGGLGSRTRETGHATQGPRAEGGTMSLQNSNKALGSHQGNWVGLRTTAKLPRRVCQLSENSRHNQRGAKEIPGVRNQEMNESLRIDDSSEGDP